MHARRVVNAAVTAAACPHPPATRSKRSRAGDTTAAAAAATNTDTGEHEREWSAIHDPIRGVHNQYNAMSRAPLA